MQQNRNQKLNFKPTEETYCTLLSKDITMKLQQTNDLHLEKNKWIILKSVKKMGVGNISNKFHVHICIFLGYTRKFVDFL